MKKVTFLVDEILEERQYDCGFPTLAEAAISAGHNVVSSKYIPFTRMLNDVDWHSVPRSQPLIVHGTIEFCRNFNNTVKAEYCPGVYQNDVVKSFDKFAVPLRKYLLNDDYYILPWKEFVARGLKEPVFIKPLSGLKQFTGMVINQDNFDVETNAKYQLEKVDDGLLCVISSPKEIKAEFRYIICDKQVVTGSEYRWDNVLDVRIDTLPECDKLAQEIAGLDWQADYVYVCDIAMTDKGPKVIELNSFSSSGFYACDTHKIVDAVSRMAWKEFVGDI